MELTKELKQDIRKYAKYARFIAQLEINIKEELHINTNLDHDDIDSYLDSLFKTDSTPRHFIEYLENSDKD